MVSTPADAPAVAPVAPATKPVPAVPAGGQVVLTASDDVWMRVYDADDKTLYLGTMKPGKSFTVPATAKDPMINVGRPDKLAVTLDGKPVPPLGSGERAIKDVKIGGTAIAGRLAGAPVATPTPDATPTPRSETHRASETTHRDRHAEETPRKAPLSETQRANLDAAAHPPAATGNASTP